MSGWLDGKAWEELEALEFDGRLLFPDVLKVLSKDGTFREVPIMLRVPRADERLKARVEARKWCKKLELDPEKDAGQFDALETYCLVARSVRERKPPHEQHCTHEALVVTYDVQSIM